MLCVRGERIRSGALQIRIVTLGGLVTSPESARGIVDAWLHTELASGWESPLRELLQRAVEQVRALEKRASVRWSSLSGR